MFRSLFPCMRKRRFFMHFRRFAAVLCAVLGATLVGASAAAPKVAVSGHTFKVNGKTVAPQAYNIDGYNYFKLRDVAYLLADTTAPFNVTWSASQSTVVNIVPGQKYQKVGGELSASTLTSLKVSASTFKVLMKGKTLPLRGYLINGNNYYSIADIKTNTVVVLVTVAIAAVVMIALDAIFGGILGLIIGA